jgi:glyoxylase-like metal-dependent hydrolase (beta-lactamase superfamily II)
MKIVTLALWAGSLTCAQDAKTILDASSKAMGAADLKTIQYSATGSSFNVGQNVSPTKPWPEQPLKRLVTQVGYATPSLLYEITNSTPAGDVRVSTFAVTGAAWNLANNTLIPAPDAVGDRLAQVWITPHGFLKGAMANNAVAKPGKGAAKTTVVSFTSGKYKYEGVIGPDNLVERTRTWIENPVLGNMLVETEFTGYQDYKGVKFPSKIMQNQGGFPALSLNVTAVSPNERFDLQAPAGVAQATIPPVQVQSTKVADGVWYITGGSHHSVLVEFKDHLALIETPQNEARTRAVLNEVKKLSSKPVRYAINTHHHFDHSGGVRTAAADKITIVTHAINKPFYSKLFKAKIEIVQDKRVFTDGARTVELYQIQGSRHNDGLLMAYLPKEKILVEADVYNPPAVGASPPSPPNPNTVNLYENIQRLKLDVNQVLGLHGRAATFAELKLAAGAE